MGQITYSKGIEPINNERLLSALQDIADNYCGGITVKVVNTPRRGEDRGAATAGADIEFYHMGYYELDPDPIVEWLHDKRPELSVGRYSDFTYINTPAEEIRQWDARSHIGSWILRHYNPRPMMQPG